MPVFDTTTFNILGVKLIKDGDMVYKTEQKRGPYERPCLELWERLTFLKGTMIDVGSYNGLYAILAAKKGCTVAAYEPNPVMVQRIKNNAALNSVAFDIHNCALFSTKGQKEIRVPVGRAMSSGVGFFRLDGTRMKVETRILDDVPYGNITAIKIDAEYSEVEIIKGGLNLLTKFKPVLIAETLRPESVIRLNDILLPLGYQHSFLMKHMSVWSIGNV